jgi:hypothetical protein
VEVIAVREICDIFVSIYFVSEDQITQPLTVRAG